MKLRITTDDVAFLRGMKVEPPEEPELPRVRPSTAYYDPQRERLEYAMGRAEHYRRQSHKANLALAIITPITLTLAIGMWLR